MKTKNAIYIIIIGVIFSILFIAAKSNESSVEDQFIKMMYKNVQDFSRDFEYFEKAIFNLQDNQLSKDSLKTAFNHARYSYKKLELLLEYYNPDVVKVLNGPLVTKVDLYDKDKVFEPEGFQVMEGLVYTSNPYPYKDKLMGEFLRVKSLAKRMKNDLRALSTSEAHVFEMMRSEIIRITALGITGADATISFNSINETICCLQSIQEVTNIFKTVYPTKGLKSYRKVNKLCEQAITYLNKNNDFDAFNRAVFTKDYLNPLSEALLDYERNLDVKLFSFITAFNFKAKHIFDKNAIDPNSFALININDSINSSLKVNLGKMLFFDPVLSKNSERSCASCHSPGKAFTDGQRKSIAMDFNGTVTRNAPTIINAVLQKSLFYDGRVTFLEHQVADVLANPIELHGNFEDIIPVIRQSEEYKRLFLKAFKGTKDTIITTNAIAVAMAQYEKSLIGLNSRFDKYMRNEKVKFTSSEINGYNIFSGKGKCATCHFPPLFSGVVPPSFQDQEFEVIGVPSSKTGKEIDPDFGRFYATNIEQYKHSFRTPSIRNVAVTAPYMHNGVYDSLEEVMDFYNKGAGKNLTIPLENMTLPFDSLNLSKKEISDVIAFMNALTDTTGLTNMPKSLPLFNNPVIDKRKIGGSY